MATAKLSFVSWRTGKEYYAFFYTLKKTIPEKCLNSTPSTSMDFVATNNKTRSLWGRNYYSRVLSWPANGLGAAFSETTCPSNMPTEKNQVGGGAVIFGEGHGHNNCYSKNTNLPFWNESLLRNTAMKLKQTAGAIRITEFMHFFHRPIKTKPKRLKLLCFEIWFWFRLQVKIKIREGGWLRGNKPNQLGPFEWVNLTHNR